tara:strand:+ start:99 stop:689 length:591 start_codon:yes stop_codon:yes gene_type:complete
MQISSKATIHPTAIVDQGANIGDDSFVWHWSHISAGAYIGEKCTIGQNVYIANNVKIGKNVKIQNNVSIYDKVTLEDDVFCGPSMVFTNVYNPRSEINRKDAYMTTHVKKGVTLGANCTVVCGIIIERYAFIGAASLVNKDIKAFALVIGVPAKQIGWMSRYGERIPLPLEGNGEWICKKTGDQYKLIGNKILLEI